MILSVEQLESELLELSSRERRRLIEVLSASLDEGTDSDPDDVEAAWAEEIRLRVEEYRAGHAETVPADEVFARLRALSK